MRPDIWKQPTRTLARHKTLPAGAISDVRSVAITTATIILVRCEEIAVQVSDWAAVLIRRLGL